MLISFLESKKESHLWDKKRSKIIVGYIKTPYYFCFLPSYYYNLLLPAVSWLPVREEETEVILCC